MRLFFVYDYKRSGTESVVRAMSRALIGLGHHVDSMAIGKIGVDIPKNFDRSFKGYDAVHFWNMRGWQHFYEDIIPPFGMTSHGFGGKGVLQEAVQKHYIDVIRTANPNWIHVMDTFTLQVLGREDVYAFLTPQCIDHEGFHRLPPPEEKAIACIGHDGDGFKRHDAIKKAADILGVPCIAHNSSEVEVDKEEVIDIYRRCAVYIDACFGGCGPVPPQEALLCGRPVAVTHIDTMNQVVIPGVNGLFHTGTPKSIAKAVRTILDNYTPFYLGTAKTKLLSAVEAAILFVRGIEEELS